MLCSDGLWGFVDDSTIADILGDDAPLQNKADRLQTAALEAGGSDNITVILVSFEFQ
jgi:protein phosphatase